MKFRQNHGLLNQCPLECLWCTGRNKPECLPHGAYVLSRDSGLTQGTDMYMACYGTCKKELGSLRGWTTMLRVYLYRTLREGLSAKRLCDQRCDAERGRCGIQGAECCRKNKERTQTQRCYSSWKVVGRSRQPASCRGECSTEGEAKGIWMLAEMVRTVGLILSEEGSQWRIINRGVHSHSIISQQYAQFQNEHFTGHIY